MPGTLHLLPTPLADRDLEQLPPPVLALARRLDYFIVESEKQARRFLVATRKTGPGEQVDLTGIRWEVLPKVPPEPVDVERMLQVLRTTGEAGLLSDGGCPAVADPGAAVVAQAHRWGIRVVPHIGPSSILLALMASGLDGQRFAFHGYLPPQSDERKQTLQTLEQQSRKGRQTQLFIETPYRNRQLLEAILHVCQRTTRLCLAVDLTMPTEDVRTRTVAEWREDPPEIHKRPTLFLFQAQR